jgi:hypothetical protein
MTTTRSQGISEDKFGIWFRRESWRAVKRGAVLFAAGLALSQLLIALSPDFSATWDSLNYQLSRVALDQHPLALARVFAQRLGDNEYGWNPLDFAAPFNVTLAQQALRHEFPKVATVQNGVPLVPRAERIRRANPELYDRRMAAYLRRYQQIENSRFSSLYDRDDVFTPPNANVQLGILATKAFGLPDALIHTVASIFTGGLASVLLFSTVLALSGRALWRSRRPARLVLKLIVWPTLASTLVWAAIVFMAVASALFGGLTINTSALALAATAPFLYLLAQAPLHLGESLMLKAPAPRKWDGVERRKPRPPVGETAATPPPAVPPPGSGA